jgi:hypothetical protein
VIAGPELTSKGFDDEDGHKLIAAAERNCTPTSTAS